VTDQERNEMWTAAILHGGGLRRWLPPGFPRIVTLCGSTRFLEAYQAEQRRRTLLGEIVISVGLFGHAEAMDMEGSVKAGLDRLHFRKIDVSDAICVVSEKGYIGHSTRNEIAYAIVSGKQVEWMEESARLEYCKGV
jgi:hypothetical protein